MTKNEEIKREMLQKKLNNGIIQVGRSCCDSFLKIKHVNRFRNYLIKQQKEGGVFVLGDAILAIVLLVMGGYILNEVSAYPDYSNLSVIGPEVFPKLIAIFFIISAIWFLATVIWKGWIKKVDADGNSYIETEKAKVQAGIQSMKGNKSSIIHLVITIILMIAYALLLPTVGFEVLTIVFLIATMFMNGVRKPHVLAIVSVVSVVVIYIFFVVILKAQIPRMFYF